ncbi:MAG: hypothetical protein KGR18_05640 [Acidobacteria bacterium]|nr:hypothetical protein [Acidobacteriota bacterium]
MASPDTPTEPTLTRNQRRRRRLSAVLGAILTLMVFTTSVSFWARDAVFEGTNFANTSVKMLDAASVRAELADAITEKLVATGPSRLASFQTVLRPAIEQLLGTEVFRSIFRSAIIQAQQSLLTEDGSEAAINLSGALGVLSGSLQVSNPDLASAIPDGTSDFFIDISSRLRDAQLWKLTRSMGDAALRSILTLIALGAAVVLLHPDRRRGVFRLGLAIAIGGGASFALGAAAPAIAASFAPSATARAALHDGTAIFVGGLITLSISLTAIGIIVCAFSVASRPERPPITPAELWAMVRARSSGWTPTTPATHVLRALLVMVAGYLIVIHRDAVAPALVFLIGSYVVYLGVIELLSVVGRTDHRSARAIASSAVQDQIGAVRSHRILGASLALIVLVGAVGLLLHTGSRPSAAGELRCNGHVQLCDRRFDEVAFAGSHNSMSARRDPGWLFAEQDQGIPAQLAQGIRALLVKTHYGIPTSLDVTGAPLVITDQGAELATSTPESSDVLTPEQQRRAAAIAASARVDPSLRGVYLCHVNCELGATLFTDALRSIRQFLDLNPNEVIVLVVGNYVSDADTEKAFREAKLFDRLWNVEPGAPWPTLREMIEARRNIVMFAEFGDQQPAWNSAAYGAYQDTPFTFRTPEALFTPGSARYTGDATVDGPVPDTVPSPTDPGTSSFVSAADWSGLPSCAPNRGTPSSPLFQINHWVTPSGAAATVEEARIINSYDVLMPRVRDCAIQRGRLPNLIGVNFSGTGDLLRVVDELNGFG